jgi:hypothetical protein
MRETFSMASFTAKGVSNSEMVMSIQEMSNLTIYPVSVCTDGQTDKYTPESGKRISKTGEELRSTPLSYTHKKASGRTGSMRGNTS